MTRAFLLLLALTGQVAAQPAGDPAPAALAAPSLVPVTPSVVTAPESSEPPPLSSGRIAGEVLGGAAIGVGGAIGGALLGYQLECSGGCHGDFGGLLGGALGAGVGFTIGVGTGVWAIGRIGNQDGSLGAAIGGSFLGLLAGAGADALLQRSGGGATEDVGNALLVAGPFVGAIVAFNLTRHYDVGAAPAVGSLVQLDRHRARIGVPIVATSSTGSYISLASGSF